MNDTDTDEPLDDAPMTKSEELAAQEPMPLPPPPDRAEEDDEPAAMSPPASRHGGNDAQRQRVCALPPSSARSAVMANMEACAYDRAEDIETDICDLELRAQRD